MGFIEDHHTVMSVLAEVMEGMVEAASSVPIERAVNWPVVSQNIPVIHFQEALERVSRGLVRDVTAEPDLAPAYEAWLGEWAQQEYGSDFLYVEGYPARKRPIYTRSFDLLFRGQEIVTGGKRLHRHADYLQALSEHGLDTRGLEGYLAAFRYGMPPHGAVAIGLERFTARLLGLSNIRQATFFPRDMHCIEP